MGLGDAVVKTMRKVFVISHTRLHEDHRHCTICQAGPFSTVEEISDHIDAHPERLNGSTLHKDDHWIFLCEPSDYYKEHPTELPESLKHLASIDEQARALGIDDHEHKLEFTDLPSMRYPN
ncbi:MAG: hypothetical protein ACJ71Q_08915 [Terriglobales bacterium]